MVCGLAMLVYSLDTSANCKWTNQSTLWLCGQPKFEFRAITGTGGLSMPMFIALRRFTLLCTMVLEFIIFRKVQDRATLAAVAVMIAGTMHLLKAGPRPLKQLPCSFHAAATAVLARFSNH